MRITSGPREEEVAIGPAGVRGSEIRRGYICLHKLLVVLPNITGVMHPRMGTMCHMNKSFNEQHVCPHFLLRPLFLGTEQAPSQQSLLESCQPPGFPPRHSLSELLACLSTETIASCSPLATAVKDSPLNNRRPGDPHYMRSVLIPVTWDARAKGDKSTPSPCFKFHSSVFPNLQRAFWQRVVQEPQLLLATWGWGWGDAGGSPVALECQRLRLLTHQLPFPAEGLNFLFK